MIDWESIPAHLRLSDREKIEPRYPGGARWWQQQESRAQSGVDDHPVHRDVACRSKYLPALLKALDGKEASVTELANALGVRRVAVPSIVGGLSFNVLVYERMENNEKRFGLLEVAS